MLQDFFTWTNSLTGSITTLTGAVALAITHFFKIFSLYEQNLSRRTLKALKELLATKSDNERFNTYLREAIFLEGYRIASGIRANRPKANFLIKLSETGHWNTYQIKKIAKFVITTTESPTPIFRITRLETAEAWLSLLFSLIILTVCSLMGVSLIFKGVSLSSVYPALAGFGIVLASFITSAWVKSNYDTYQIAREFNDYMTAHPEVLCESTKTPNNTLPIAVRCTNEGKVIENA